MSGSRVPRTAQQGISLARLHGFSLLLLVGLYMVLNQGFMQLRLPPNGVGVPVGELILLSVLVMVNYSKLLPALSTTVILTPFLLWWILGLGRAVAGTPEYGAWALRDAAHVIESLFIIAGFAFAAHPRSTERLFRWLPWILAAVCVYSLGFPIEERLQSFSPKVTAGAGYEVSLFFNYLSTSGLLLMAGAYLVLFAGRTGVGRATGTVVAAALLGYDVVLFQQRTVYLQVLAILLLFVLYRRELISRWFVVAAIIVAGSISAALFGLQLEGRLGAVSLEFLINHFLAIGGVASEGLEGAAGGVSLRIGWWLDLYGQWTAGPIGFLFGLGYGFPLVDFEGLDAAVREPHNSYVSVLARIGLLGGVAFVWMHLVLLRAWRRAYRTCTQLCWREGQDRLLILAVFFVLILVRALGEPAFEKSFNAVPYYFFWGVVLQMGRQARATYEYHASEKPQDPVRDTYNAPADTSGPLAAPAGEHDRALGPRGPHEPAGRGGAA